MAVLVTAEKIRSPSVRQPGVVQAEVRGWSLGTPPASVLVAAAVVEIYASSSPHFLPPSGIFLAYFCRTSMYLPFQGGRRITSTRLMLRTEDDENSRDDRRLSYLPSSRNSLPQKVYKKKKKQEWLTRLLEIAVHARVGQVEFVGLVVGQHLHPRQQARTKTKKARRGQLGPRSGEVPHPPTITKRDQEGPRATAKRSRVAFSGGEEEDAAAASVPQSHVAT